MRRVMVKRGRRDAGADAPQDFAGNDTEAGVAGEGEVDCVYGIDAGERRRFGGEAGEEGFDPGWRAFEFDCDAIGIVSDKAGEVLFGGEAVDKGTKSNALNHTANSNAFPLVGMIWMGCWRHRYAQTLSPQSQA